MFYLKAKWSKKVQNFNLLKEVPAFSELFLYTINESLVRKEIQQPHPTGRANYKDDG